jgi:hypothetical protein
MYREVVTGFDMDGYLSMDSTDTVRFMEDYPDSQGPGIGCGSEHAHEATGVDVRPMESDRLVSTTGKG